MSSFLISIWVASAALATFSVLLMFYLIFRRMVSDYFRRSRGQRAERLKTLLFDYLNDDLKGDVFARRVREKDQRILLNLAGRLMRGLKSAPREKLVDLLNIAIDLKIHIKALKNGSDAERAALCLQLTWTTDSGVIDAFWSLLDDESHEVVLAAANALIDCGQPLSLIDFLNKAEANLMLSHRGIRDLVRRIASNQTPELCTLLRHSNAAVISIAADALGRIRSTQGLADLADVAEHHSDFNVRASCLRALGLIGHPDAAWAVTIGLEDEAWPVRAQAAIAAGRIGLVDVIPLLSMGLDDTEWWVRFRAAEALVQLGETGAEILARAQNSEDVETSTIASLALMEAKS